MSIILVVCKSLKIESIVKVLEMKDSRPKFEDIRKICDKTT